MLKRKEKLKKVYSCGDCNTPLKKRDKSCPKCGSKHIKIGFGR